MSLTKLAGKGPLVRQTDAFDRNDPLIVTLHPKHLEIRVKYKGEGYALSYRAILCMARALEYHYRKEASSQGGHPPSRPPAEALVGLAAAGAQRAGTARG